MACVCDALAKESSTTPTAAARPAETVQPCCLAAACRMLHAEHVAVLRVASCARGTLQVARFFCTFCSKCPAAICLFQHLYKPPDAERLQLCVHVLRCVQTCVEIAALATIGVNSVAVDAILSKRMKPPMLTCRVTTATRRRVRFQVYLHRDVHIQQEPPPRPRCASATTRTFRILAR